MTPYAWELTRYGTTIIVEDDGDGALIGTFGEDGTVHGIHLDVKDVLRVRDALDDYVEVWIAGRRRK